MTELPLRASSIHVFVPSMFPEGAVRNGTRRYEMGRHLVVEPLSSVVNRTARYGTGWGGTARDNHLPGSNPGRVTTSRPRERRPPSCLGGPFFCRPVP